MLALAALISMGRRTVTGMLLSSAQHESDWSANYRVFEHKRFKPDVLFDTARSAVTQALSDDEPLVVMMDDTLIRKRGKKVHGAAWRRDPIGPKFQTNLVWGQRFLQISAALPESSGASRCRGIPIDLAHCPTVRKPKHDAPESEWIEFREMQAKMKLTAVGARSIQTLRTKLDAESTSRHLIVTADGSYTNRDICRQLPANTTLVGRIRKDAKLFAPPVSTQNGRGRRRFYGRALQTPEQIRQNESVPWVQVHAWAAGKMQSFDVKTIAGIKWRGTGDTPARLVVIRPLAFRQNAGARIRYRDPAYLICTDPHLTLEKVIQAYVWRWEIEVNFRDQKTILGVGEAQVRTPHAAAVVPMFLTAAYSFLLLAASTTKITLPRPKWQRSDSSERASTTRIIGSLRDVLWGNGIHRNKTGFGSNEGCSTKSVLFPNSLSSAVLYASR